MVNPFQIQVAQPDLNPVLQGIGSIAKQARETTQANAKQKAFMEAAQSGDPTQMTALVAKYPELSQAARDQFGITNEASGAAALDTYQRVLADPSRASEYLSAGIERVRQAGGRPDMMTSDLQMFQQDPDTALEKIRMGYAMFGGDKPAGMQEFESLTEGFTPEEIERARRIKAGLAPRAVGSASQTITDEDRAQEIADTEATIAERKKFAEMTGASRAKKIDEGFDRIVEIDQGISNIDNAITALNEGAKTGPLISKYTPTIRAQTAKLEQVRNMMALDVLNAATFGALSEKELEIVKETALPNLPPDQLREWLETRKTAEQKLRRYYQEQIDFLDQGGSVAGFLRMKERQRTGQGGSQAGQQPAQTDTQSAQPTFLGFE